MGKKKEKKMSLADFAKSSGGPTIPSNPRSKLPSAPGEQGGSGFGRRGGYGGGSRRGGFEQERSRADESTKWRRKSGTPAPKRDSGGSSYQRREPSSSFGGGQRDRSSFGGRDGGSKYGGDRDRNDRSERRREPRDDGPELGRSLFGSKKQTSGGSSFGRSDNFGERSSNSFRSGSGFGSRRDDGPRRDDGRGDEGGMLDRSSMGKKRVAIRQTAGRTRQSYISDKRGGYDGSGSGFGHQLVADCFGTVESSGVSQGLTHFSQQDKPRSEPRSVWKSVAPEKSEEQLEKERSVREEKERKRREERERREAERKEAERKRKEKEELEKQEAARKKADVEEKARMKALRTDLVDMMRNNVEPEILSEEQCHEVLPSLECNETEAYKLGVALGMTINDGNVDLSTMITLLPETFYDDILIVMCSTLTKRIGESKFLQELESQSIDFNVLVRDPDSFEQKLEQYDLKCLLTSDEENDKFEAAFARHIDLTELNEFVGAVALSPGIKKSIYGYIGKEFFTNRDVNKPEAFFTSTDLFYKITESANDIIEFIDVLIDCWCEKRPESMLVELFDHLIRNDCLPPEQVTEWNTCSTSPSKLKALVADCDYRLKNGDEVFEGDKFCNYLADVTSIYYDEEEDEDEEEEEYGAESQI